MDKSHLNERKKLNTIRKVDLIFISIKIWNILSFSKNLFLESQKVKSLIDDVLETESLNIIFSKLIKLDVINYPNKCKKEQCMMSLLGMSCYLDKSLKRFTKPVRVLQKPIFGPFASLLIPPQVPVQCMGHKPKRNAVQTSHIRQWLIQHGSNAALRIHKLVKASLLIRDDPTQQTCDSVY